MKECFSLAATLEVAIVLDIVALDGGISIIVNNMIDLTIAIEEYGKRVGEGDSWSFWGNDAIRLINDEVSEERVGTNSKGLMVGDIVGNLVCCVALVTVVVLGDIVWELRLVEEGLSILAVPLEEVGKGVLTG